MEGDKMKINTEEVKKALENGTLEDFVGNLSKDETWRTHLVVYSLHVQERKELFDKEFGNEERYQKKGIIYGLTKDEQIEINRRPELEKYLEAYRIIDEARKAA